MHFSEINLVLHHKNSLSVTK